MTYQEQEPRNQVTSAQNQNQGPRTLHGFLDTHPDTEHPQSSAEYATELIKETSDLPLKTIAPYPRQGTGT